LKGPISPAQQNVTSLSSAGGGSVLYFGTQTGTSGLFSGYDTSGKVLWSTGYAVPSTPSTAFINIIPMIGSDGTVYVQPGDGTMLEFPGGASSSLTSRSSHTPEAGAVQGGALR